MFKNLSNENLENLDTVTLNRGGNGIFLYAKMDVILDENVMEYILTTSNNECSTLIYYMHPRQVIAALKTTNKAIKELAKTPDQFKILFEKLTENHPLNGSAIKFNETMENIINA